MFVNYYSVTGSYFLRRLHAGPTFVSGMFRICQKRASLAGILYSTAVSRHFFQ